MRDFRHREDVGFERRCPDCADWWPITLEFWDPRWTTRCRSCIRRWKNAGQIERYRIDEAFREAKKAAARLTAWKGRQNDPEADRERKALYYRANRERILERSKVRYHAKKAA
jgi:hypothetical protein